MAATCYACKTVHENEFLSTWDAWVCGPCMCEYQEILSGTRPSKSTAGAFLPRSTGGPWPRCWDALDKLLERRAKTKHVTPVTGFVSKPKQPDSDAEEARLVAILTRPANKDYCMCGRVREGCEYHDPKLQPGAKPTVTSVNGEANGYTIRVTF